VKCSSFSWTPLFLQALQGIQWYMAKMFKLDVVTFCRRNHNHLYGMIQNHNQYALSEEVMGIESFAKDDYITQIMQVVLLLYPLLVAY